MSDKIRIIEAIRADIPNQLAERDIQQAINLYFETSCDNWGPIRIFGKPVNFSKGALQAYADQLIEIGSILLSKAQGIALTDLQTEVRPEDVCEAARKIINLIKNQK